MGEGSSYNHNAYAVVGAILIYRICVDVDTNPSLDLQFFGD